MNPLKLTLEGFAGIYAGRKRDKLTLDLPDLSAGLLVALVGPNGSGKSTIMDNLHPYRIMPSRAGGSYSPNAFSFYEQLSSEEACKELFWEHAGIRYRSLFKFQNGKRRKTEAYLFVLDENDNSEPAANGNLVSDGKTDTYDKVLESILGSPDTFFTSVFSAQNRKPISSYGNAEIKGLMAELLGLDSIKELGKKAAQVKNLLKAELSTQQEKLGMAQMAKRQHEAALHQVSEMENTIAQLQTEKQTAHTQLREAERQLAAITAQIQQSESVIARKASLEQSKAHLEERLRKLQAQQVQKQQQLESEHQRETISLERDILSLQKSMETAEAEIQKLQDLQSRAKSIQDAVQQEQALRVQMEHTQQEIEKRESALSAQIAHAQALQNTITQQAQDLSVIKANGENLSREKADAERQSALIQEVPCSGTDLAQRCKLLADARAAGEKIQPITIQISTLREKYRAAKEALDQKRAALTAASAEDPELVACKNRLKAIQSTLASIHPLVMEASLLEQAEKQLAQWSETLAAKQREQAEKTARKAQATTAFQAAITALPQEFAEETANLDAEIQRIVTELSAIVLPDIQSKAERESACKLASDTLERIETAIQQSQNRLIDAKAQAQSLLSAANDISALQDQVNRMGEEMRHWEMFIKAFGNDGIIALSIDDVGPTLSAYANDLLMACYGPRFTVSIQTQTTNAKGEDREGFDIAVFDAETQESKSVEKMSGGERVWINEAMTRAIALFLAKESGQQYATLFTDEADGALDPDRKRRFMHMKREVLKLGGYTREYFVSQTPELWEMADYILDVSKL